MRLRDLVAPHYGNAAHGLFLPVVKVVAVVGNDIVGLAIVRNDRIYGRPQHNTFGRAHRHQLWRVVFHCESPPLMCSSFIVACQGLVKNLEQKQSQGSDARHMSMDSSETCGHGMKKIALPRSLLTMGKHGVQSAFRICKSAADSHGQPSV
jgi:hypothetical protein